jgi:hypothetical protein
MNSLENLHEFISPHHRETISAIKNGDYAHFRIEGGQLGNANWLVQTKTGIDRSVCNALRYDPSITSVMPMAGGCLTRKNTQECLTVLTQCLAVFVDFFTFCYFFTICNFCNLLFIVQRGKVCYFFLLVVTFINYFLLGHGNYSIHCATGEFERVHLDFILFYFYFYC